MILWLMTSFLIGMAGAFLVARSGLGWGLVDTPKERSSHKIPIPKGGGIGILGVLVISVLWWHIPWTLWIPACTISLVSLLGDYRDISFKIRLTVQIGSAMIFSGSLFSGEFIAKLPIEISILLILFGILFITATANFFNFMDGINGIAGLTGMIAFSLLGFYGLFDSKDTAWVVTAFGISVACFGFLPLNFPRAKVFMGDVGSVLLGFLFASWVVYYSQSILEFLFLVSFLFPFYADELSTLFIRIKDRDRLTKAHRRHIYQILANQAGFSHTFVTLVYGFIQIVIVILAWFAAKADLIVLLGLLLFLSGLFFLVGIYVRRRWEVI